jgi:hypothetical protein
MKYQIHFAFLSLLAAGLLLAGPLGWLLLVLFRKSPFWRMKR